MNKAFTKEDSSNEPVIVPERAPLPPGVPNYVTERGMRLLEEERKQLVAERARLAAQDSEADGEARQKLAALNKRLRDLGERIATAQTVAPRPHADRAVRFGATVTLKSADKEAAKPLRLKLVGVDEAGERADYIAFCAPIATAMLGRRPGDQLTRRTSAGEEALVIVDVEYEETNLR